MPYLFHRAGNISPAVVPSSEKFLAFQRRKRSNDAINFTSSGLPIVIKRINFMETKLLESIGEPFVSKTIPDYSILSEKSLP
ncbi:45989_t:CDS:2 [Gigaspora margarita]|uniref:45989_t:CDS:1 n=1 Tax=Gigaspora margarita TaxID=4874 RepID=A0ABN7UEN1_GIGMA|nr:45989_t:CDS:2 [Gigaspora margarita]